MRILIAEDDVSSRHLLVAVLKKSGHDVRETVDGAEAWRALQEQDAPELVILDWMMPGMDGLEVVRRVRALQSARPPYIIIMTARDQETDIVAGKEAGADDYLTKPIDVAELRARVEVGVSIIEQRK